MKFALVVLLGLCAVVAQAAVIRDDPPVARLEITEAMRQKVEEFIEKAKQEFEVVRQKVQEIAEKTIEKLKQIVEQGKAKFAEISKQVEDKVAELEQKGGPSEECVEKHQAELEDVKREAEDDLHQCVDGAMESAKSYREEIEADIAEIKKDIDEVRGVIDECADANIITAAKCVYGKLDEVKSSLRSIFGRTQDATKIALQKAGEVISDARECNDAAYTKFAEKLKEIHDNIVQCYQDGQKN